MTQRRAFTLIELLVVIAIIAILAAILFPVFAQAKNAAKKTVAVSNVKQMLTSFVLYQSDSDDMLVVKARIGYGPAQNGGDPTVAMTWDKLVQPYTKNYELLTSQADTRPKYKTPFGMTRRGFAVASNLFRGIQLNPNFGWGDFPLMGSISDSGIPDPANTVSVGEKRQPYNIDPDLWNKDQWQEGMSIYCTRKSDMPASDQRAQYGEIQNAYGDGAIWGFADSHAAYKKANGKASDGVVHGTVFPGYRAGRYGTDTPDGYWDQGIVCMDYPWNSNDTPNCPLPGER
ncbi:prepilin-type N-terminal cleavage/methylation domain-containing protein [bacterium]|nr:MAG: prepilin-type N-terminal cleavage/methylation domain-containing protein [bacterium]